MIELAYAFQDLFHSDSVLEKVEFHGPAMERIDMVKIKSDGTRLYDLTKLEGEILFKFVCSDGIVVVVKR